MFISSEKEKLLASDTLHVRCLQTPTASFICVNTSQVVCSLVLSDFESCHSSPTSGGAGGLRRKSNLVRGMNISRGWIQTVKVMWGLLVFHFVSKDFPLFQLGFCFVYWKKMVSWLFWPIKAVLWFWPFGNSACCLIICCCLLPFLGTYC